MKTIAIEKCTNVSKSSSTWQPFIFVSTIGCFSYVFFINVQVFKPALWQLAVANNKMSNSLRTTQLIWLNKNAHIHTNIRYVAWHCGKLRQVCTRGCHFFLHIYKRFSCFFPQHSCFIYDIACSLMCNESSLKALEKKYEYIISCANSAAILLSNVNLPQFYCHHGMHHQRHNNFLMSSCGVACN